MPQPGALIDVESYKKWAGLSTSTAGDDALLSAFIDAATAGIQRFTRRVFRKSAISEYHDGMGTRTLRLRRPPIWSVTSVQIVDGATVVETIPATAYVVPRLATDADTEVDWNDGRIILLAREWPVGYRNVLVTYTGGFDPIPAPVQQACRELVASLFLSKGRDIGVTVETAASVTGAGGSVDRRPGGAMARAIKERLAPYRLPVPLGVRPESFERTRDSAW